MLPNLLPAGAVYGAVPAPVPAARRRPSRRLFPLSACLAVATASTLLGSATSVVAAPFNQAKVVRIVDGNEVFIDSKRARVNQAAGNGSRIQTRRSRAELLFDRRAIGLLGRQSLIELGARCFTLSSGAVVVNGNQRACLGSQVLGIAGTTYVLTRDPDDGFTLSVLAGESVVSPELGSTDSPADAGMPSASLPAAPDPATDILATYPRLKPWTGLQAGGFGAAYPSGGGSFTGGLSFFTPVHQSSARSIVYSATSAGTSFQNLWGVSTEIGYRWLMPSIQSTNSLYFGYSGYGVPGCYANMLNAGAQWERSRWRLGASGGLKVNSCATAFNYAALNLSVPLWDNNSKPIYLSISPYLLEGNVVGTALLSANASSSTFPGVRLSFEIPVVQDLSLRAYGGADSVFGVTVGGYITYRFPVAGQILRDPNMPAVPESSLRKTAASAAGSSLPFTGHLPHVPVELATLAAPWQPSAGVEPTSAATAMTDAPGQALIIRSPSLAQQPAAPVTVRQGQKARFSANGDLLAVEPLSNRDFLLLIQTHFKGQNPLPESHRIAKLAQSRGIRSALIAGILGTDFLSNASQPVSVTVDTPFSPLTQMPAGRYVCAATSQARAIGAEQAAPGQFDYSGGAVYFGKGSKTSQGYPATYNKSDAFIFSDPGVCNELNRAVNAGYDVVQAEPI